MKKRTLADQIQSRCVYFNGLAHDNCECGIAYAVVRDTSQRPYRYPCLSTFLGGHCAHAEFLTDEEAQAEADETRRMLDAFLNKIKIGICPHCDAEIKSKQQVGRCVYANPCGCRLYQGKI